MVTTAPDRLDDRLDGRLGGWWRRPGAGDTLDGEEARLERQLGWTRLVGGVAVLASVWQNPTEVPSWITMLVVVAGAVFLAGAGVTLLVVPRLATPRTLVDSLAVVDAIVLGMLLPFGAAQDSPYLFLMFTVTALLGGVRLGRLGVLRNLVIAAPFETLRLIAGQALFGDQSVEDTVVAILIGGGLGLLVADVATAGQRARRRAREERVEAADDRVRLHRVTWEAEVLADVVAAAGTGPVHTALVDALERACDQLALASVDLLTIGTGDHLVVVASTDPDLEAGTIVTILPGGPKDRAMSLGTVAAATHDDLAALEDHDGRPRGSVVAAPMPLDGRLLGVLVCGSSPGDLLHRRDAVLVGRLGRSLAPFVGTRDTTAPGTGGGEADDPEGGEADDPEGAPTTP